METLSEDSCHTDAEDTSQGKICKSLRTKKKDFLNCYVKDIPSLVKTTKSKIDRLDPDNFSTGNTPLVEICTNLKSKTLETLKFSAEANAQMMYHPTLQLVDLTTLVDFTSLTLEQLEHTSVLLPISTQTVQRVNSPSEDLVVPPTCPSTVLEVDSPRDQTANQLIAQQMISSAKNKCQYCCKQLGNRSNLVKHIKKVHKRNTQDEIISDIPRAKFLCDLCNKEYFFKYSLKKHMNNVHLSEYKDNFLFCSQCDFKTKHQFNLKRHIKLLHLQKNGKPSERSFKCSLCNFSYSHERNLNYHKRKAHDIGKPMKVFKRKCPLCSYVSIGHNEKDIYNHFGNSHDIQIRLEEYTFDSVKEFDAWKDTVENKTASFFKRTFKSKNPSKSAHVYRCHRSGIYTPTGSNKRLLKKSGSCKINGFCPASIKATFNDNGVHVLYTPSHIGHNSEPVHLRLSKEDRRSIAIQLASGKPHEKVIDWLKSSKPNSEISRFHIIKKKDLINIESSFNVFEEVLKRSIDPVSIDDWVKKLEELKTTAFILYKQQGTESAYLNKNDFLLIYMTTTQKEMLQAYGNDNICIEGTLNPNHYYVQLYTLLILDELQEGYPVAFMFTNRQDEHIVTVFYEAIKTVTGPINVDVFMSSMEDSFYLPWLETMGPARVRMFCSWHVLKAWRDIVISKIKNKLKQYEVYKILKTLLYETDESLFHSLLSQTVEKFCNDEGLKEFLEYFEVYYTDNTYKAWAHCYIVNAGVNRNISMQTFNRFLRYCYVKGKTVCGLDKPLCVMFALAENKPFDFLSNVIDKKKIVKLKSLRTTHRKSLLITRNLILQCEDNWQIELSSQTESCIVKKIKNCNSCQLQCHHCDSCFHEFVCSCSENCIKKNMCKHIHAVANVHKSGNGLPELETYSIPTGDISSIDQELDNYLKGNDIAKIVTPLEEDKIKFNTDIRKLLEMIRSPEQMEYVKNEVTKIMATVESMNLASSNILF